MEDPSEVSPNDPHEIGAILEADFKHWSRPDLLRANALLKSESDHVEKLVTQDRLRKAEYDASGQSDWKLAGALSRSALINSRAGAILAKRRVDVTYELMVHEGMAKFPDLLAEPLSAESEDQLRFVMTASLDSFGFPDLQDAMSFLDDRAEILQKRQEAINQQKNLASASGQFDSKAQAGLARIGLINGQAMATLAARKVELAIELDRRKAASKLSLPQVE